MSMYEADIAVSMVTVISGSMDKQSTVTNMRFI
jgi:hypothetical protein